VLKTKINVLATLLLVASSTVYAGSISGSPHDLTGSTNSKISVTGDNGELCVYCHTPHASNVSFTGAPLWNKDDIDATSFTMYGAGAANTAGATIAGTAIDTNPASPSLACLSCHDGVSAVDSIVNAPGSGLGSLLAGTTAIDASLTTVYGGNIGQNLTNDHPVSVIYDTTGAAASLRAITTTLTTTNSSTTAWLGATTVGDLLRNDRVECGSCHDPHNGGLVQGTATEVNFLRISNANSDLCKGCHNK
jgi:hypothetical protein